MELDDSCLGSLLISVEANSRDPNIVTAFALQWECLSSHDL